MNDAEILADLEALEPPKDLLSWTKREDKGKDLGPEYIIWTSERVRQDPSLYWIMELNEPVGRSKWMARCHCQNCQETFYTEKVTGKDAIMLTEGEDGYTYCYADDIESANEDDMAYEMGNVLEIHDGDNVMCPRCGQYGTLIHKKMLLGGRQKQLCVAAAQKVGSRGALVYWMVSRIIYPSGADTYEVLPRDAYVIADEKRNIRRYSHRENGCFCDVPGDRWRRCKKTTDSGQKCYSDWGSINNRKSGFVIYPIGEDLTGTTGEKSAFEVCCENSMSPVEYLKLWRIFPAVENLMRSGCTNIVADVLRSANLYQYDLREEAKKVFDLKKKKPHEILGLTKEEFRSIPHNEIRMEAIELLRRYRKVNPEYDALRFFGISTKWGKGFVDLCVDYGDAPEKIDRYLTKQNRTCRMLIDARRMAKKLSGADLTSEELYPRHLQSAHDRLSAQIATMESEEKSKRLQAGFDEIFNRYAATQWTDGNLCVVIPKSNDDLVREGKILRHCVGGYGNNHASGKSCIFFIRHYRRPERCYYTLNIGFSLGRPEHIQLRGYGNERHGESKQYWHHIPQRVIDFCNRWEQEILIPYCNKLKKEKSA